MRPLGCSAALAMTERELAPLFLGVSLAWAGGFERYGRRTTSLENAAAAHLDQLDVRLGQRAVQGARSSEVDDNRFTTPV